MLHLLHVVRDRLCEAMKLRVLVTCLFKYRLTAVLRNIISIWVEKDQCRVYVKEPKLVQRSSVDHMKQRQGDVGDTWSHKKQ